MQTINEMDMSQRKSHKIDELGLSFQIERVKNRSLAAGKSIQNMLIKHPDLQNAAFGLCEAYLCLAAGFEQGGTLFIFGNGGSMADALHISGELMKSYKQKRMLPRRIKERLNKYDEDNQLAEHLESGLPAIVLGLNPALNTAIDNDFSERWINIAQELQSLAKPGDVFLGITTSGKAKNIFKALQTSKALNVSTILLTGEKINQSTRIADIVIHAPGTQTDVVQQAHEKLYHCLCEMLEIDFFD
jgi:D-sedoheptulose 7-phosphate isomerase